MFSFPKGPQPRAHEVAGLGDRARLVIEVPHWTAVVTMIDNSLRPVEGFSKLAPLPGTGDKASTEAEVPPGAYNIEIKLGRSSQSMWVVAEPGHETRVPADAWDGVALATSMPLASAIDGTPPNDPVVGEVQRLSLTSAPPAPAGLAASCCARLFLVGRLTGPAEARSAAAWDLQLIDDQGNVAANLSDQPPTQADGFWNCTLDLPKGYYVLRAREGSASGGFHRCQPLYLCGGWENHVFIQCDESPRLATLSFNMSRLGVGFHPDDDATIAAASVLGALAGEDAARTVLGTSKMEQLLHGEMHNPWLGVLAGYALASAEGSGEAAELLADVKRFLRREIGDHPDVRALMLSASDPTVPLDYPPMLRAGLHRIRAFAVERPEAAVAESPLARVGQRFVCDSPWTAWVERDEDTSMQPPSDESGETCKASIQVLAGAMPSSAAIYPLSGPGEPPSAGRYKSAAEQVAIIEAAETVLSATGRQAPAAVTLPIGDSVERLLDIDRDIVNRCTVSAGAAFEEGLNRLANPIEHLGIVEDSGGGPAVQSVVAAIFDAKRCASMAWAAEHPEEADERAWWRPTALEDHIDRLGQEARRMRAVAEDKASLTPEQVGHARTLSERLDRLAENLAARAHLVIITDEDGRLRYGNKLLYDRLQHRDDPADVLDRLHRALGAQSNEHALVPAATLSPTSPEARRGAMIEIHRTVVQGEQDEVKAYIYLLREADVRNLKSDQTTSLNRLLPTITLLAATAQHGDREASVALDELDELTGELERILA